MSWRDNKKSRGGYSRGRGRGYRGQNRGERNSRQQTSKNQDEGVDQGQNSGLAGGDGDRGKALKRTQANQSINGKRTRFEVGERLKEVDVGITEFFGDHKRFAGILKERFSDFHVHEISCDGEICKLTNQDIPPEPQELEDMNKLKESVPEEVRQKLETFATADSDTSTTEIDVTEMDKELRRNIHTIAKKIPFIVSETIERNEKKFIILAKKSKTSSHKFRSDRRVDWSKREGNYCYFLLHKVNMDTMDALNQMASKLHIKSDMFHYAGTKDRRGRTTQWVSLKKISPSSIHRAAKQVRGAHVGNFRFSKDPLKLGMLDGNHFKIVLRSVNATDEEIERAMISLKDRGFVNYYGLQRFGTIAAVPTYEIGKALLQGKWENAIDLILKPRLGERQEDMIRSREIYERTKNATLALRPISQSGKIEAKLLQGIINCGEKNPQGALDHIPRNARLMYIHAYQSFVWNHMVSRRIREFGVNPIVGDLVYEKSDLNDTPEPEMIDNPEQKSDVLESKAEAPDNKDKDEQVATKEVNEEVTKMLPGSVNDENLENMKIKTENETFDEPNEESNLPAIKVLGEEDLTSYSFADIIMPKPGWKVTYPSYAKSWYDEFLAKDGLTTDLRQKNKKYSLGGAYRKIVGALRNLSWKITRYNGYHDDLVLCDIDEMHGKEPPKSEIDGKFKALILEFSLKSSMYATMALREILEYDTSAQTHAVQSAANQARNEENEDNDYPVKSADSIAKDKNGDTEKLEDFKENMEETIPVETNDHDTVLGIEKTNDLPKKIAMETDKTETEIVMDEVNIPKVKEDCKIDTESNEIFDITDKSG